MADAEDAHDIVLEGEKDAVVAVQGSDITAAGAGVVKNAVEDGMAVGRSRRRTSALAPSSHSIG